ncbi:hypothetical protein [Paenibacillus polymyxa]|uniref:hypothetical protein n=1 Tax=Paenibacillus polymyxa TaxID=1406 RepID=UPI000B814E64|nr:hypothetical protein [Paenibacillus polymyxa]
MDKKIQEIRTALAEATPGPWGIGAPSPSGAINIGAKGLLVAQCAKKEQAHLIANAPTYISHLLQQIDIKDKALEFYEDEMNYTEAITVPGEEESFLLILEDKGRVARAALKGEDTNEQTHQI